MNSFYFYFGRWRDPFFIDFILGGGFVGEV